MLEAQLFARAVAYHAEGPFWDERTDSLLFVDALAGTVVSVDDVGVSTRHQLPIPVVTVIRRRASGGYAVATEHGIALCDESLTMCDPIAEVTSDPALRTNDGGCDPLGGFIIGTMAYATTPGAGSVFRVSADHRVTTLLEDVSISNGVQWSADGSQVFYVDTPTRRIDVFDVDPVTGGWSGRRNHAWIGQPNGFPDGMAIDEEGGLWVALWGAGCVSHFDVTGRHVETINVPGVSQVSSCAFGGSDRNVLFITTSAQDLAPGIEPLAGSVFAVQTDTLGAPLAEFAG
ncbi:SMP-30/gluconolactonase/LRE family protein [Mycobacterium sp. RTGN5]|uniref:SMP-30/gluconolactonase/LRE family protein n=1 Tax=Mycobacterium sp. RTGN5 TaxID=3016522 RepID=UPI0029C67A02|nr:SMP-30/gluconolactonase/LRE family protein [Mycobacterium sp. RTGN5]